MLKVGYFLCGLILSRPSVVAGGFGSSSGGFYDHVPHNPYNNKGYMEGMVSAYPADGGWGSQWGQPQYFPDPAYLLPAILNNPSEKTSLEEPSLRRRKKKKQSLKSHFQKGQILNPNSAITAVGKCDGKGNLIQDIGLLAIISGGVGTMLGIFSASYLSVVGNTISVISAIISFATGIPSAIITYLAASDKLSYALANVLSVLSIANTFYGIWSVDFGNQDIILSQAANFIGVFSLFLSIATGFPDIFDEMLKLGDYGLGPGFTRFVRGYGCHKATGYSVIQEAIKKFIKLGT